MKVQVLVADDDDMVREVLVEFLQTFKPDEVSELVIHEAKTPVQEIDLITKSETGECAPWDLVVQDIKALSGEFPWEAVAKSGVVKKMLVLSGCMNEIEISQALQDKVKTMRKPATKEFVVQAYSMILGQELSPGTLLRA